MGELSIYRFRGKTRFNSITELPNGEVLCAYLNREDPQVFRRYRSFLSAAENLRLSAPEYDLAQLELLQESVLFIDEWILSMPPYDQVPPRENTPEGRSRLSGFRLPLSSPAKYCPEPPDYIPPPALAYYQTLYETLVRLQKTHRPYITDYYYRNGVPSSPHDTVHTLAQFFADRQGRTLEIYERLVPISKTVEPTILYPDSPAAPGKLTLWEHIRYRHIGDFLEDEFSEVLRARTLIKKCECCGRFFLISQHYNTDYCENIAPGETSKTCREIGAQRVFRQKVNSDPVWLAYQRAYKTRYARMMKKKISKAEFLAWADKAIELRTAALDHQIEFDDYLTRLKA